MISIGLDRNQYPASWSEGSGNGCFALGPIQAMGNFKRLFCVYCQAFGDNHDRLSHFTRNIENGLTQKLPEFGQGVGGGTQGRELVRFCPPSDRLICRHEVDRSAGQVHV